MTDTVGEDVRSVMCLVDSRVPIVAQVTLACESSDLRRGALGLGKLSAQSSGVRPWEYKGEGYRPSKRGRASRNAWPAGTDLQGSGIRIDGKSTVAICLAVNERGTAAGFATMGAAS